MVKKWSLDSHWRTQPVTILQEEEKSDEEDDVPVWKKPKIWGGDKVLVCSWLKHQTDVTIEVRRVLVWSNNVVTLELRQIVSLQLPFCFHKCKYVRWCTYNIYIEISVNSDISSSGGQDVHILFISLVSVLQDCLPNDIFSFNLYIVELSLYGSALSSYIILQAFDLMTDAICKKAWLWSNLFFYWLLC